MKNKWKVIAATVCVAVTAATACGCAGSYRVLEGTYSYEAYSTLYGCNVRVVTQGDMIRDVVIRESHDMTQASPTWTGRPNYLELENQVLEAYRGLSVSQVMAIKVSVAEGGAPSNMMNYPSGSKIVMTGATQSTGRILLAVQDALKKLADKV